ncbi:MAG: 2-oxoglutarate dehydrogenase E1 component [Alphaproteobacteria bacterium]|nr:2-oxoglutarate dehydrogenase E1 component [Alphaproteobacteria bacterium]
MNMGSEQSSFLYSANADFIAELYKRYTESPAAVDVSWRNFFQSLGDDVRDMLAEMGGASWAPERQDRVISNQNEPAKAEAKGKLEVLPTDRAAVDSYRIQMMITAYRRRGHYHAKLDPLGLASYAPAAKLGIEDFGFAEADLDRPIFVDGAFGLQTATLREIVDRLRATYCGSIGIEYMHILDMDQHAWIRDRMEQWGGRTNYSTAMKREILQRLTAADSFERFLATKFVGVKRFGLEGGEAMIPALEMAITTGAKRGLREVVVGMAHRGRLNMLTNVLGKSFTALFSEFQGMAAYPDSVQGSGDVKYHLGTSIDRDFDGQNVHLTMNPNPSHLEWVNPVVTGRVRAKQQQRSGHNKLTNEAGAQVMALLIHGDAAFAGQGIVGETMLLSELKGYRTAGTLHYIINNQVGFTTSPQFSRSGVYSCDSAKVLQAPIFHVNGDDVEAVVFVTQMAIEFRQAFQKDAFIDMVCYRRHGHNEGDEPAFTQPIMYRVIKDHPTTRDIYARKLVAEGSLPQAEVDKIAADYWAGLEGNFKAATDYKPQKADWLEGKWQGLEVAPHELQDVDTGVDLAKLRGIGEALSRVPESFNVNPKIAKQMEAKRDMMTSGQGIDWATAEALAFGSLLTEGHPVRLSGQDCGRGTFSQRHSVLHDQQTDARYVPLNNIPDTKTYYDVHDSPLSEAAVMGFDYGFSLAEPNALVCWEGQFGDFANTAQVIIDQFITSSESKWLRMSGITLLLPHGYEGQGPEHSSARLERYLQMCAEDNIQVANCSTPANYFHILRRQVRRNFRKPLVLMTPKSLLRHKLCVSSLQDMAGGTSFHRVIGETQAMVEDKKVRRVVICSGKLYYDLLATRTERKINDVALVRLEQFYPFPQKELATELARYAKADVVWCQEEPENMGAWTFLDRRIEAALASINHRAGRPAYVGRPESAATACGSLKRHNKEQAELVDKALTVR